MKDHCKTLKQKGSHGDISLTCLEILLFEVPMYLPPRPVGENRGELMRGRREGGDAIGVALGGRLIPVGLTGDVLKLGWDCPLCAEIQ